MEVKQRALIFVRFSRFGRKALFRGNRRNYAPFFRE